MVKMLNCMFYHNFFFGHNPKCVQPGNVLEKSRHQGGSLVTAVGKTGQAPDTPGYVGRAMETEKREVSASVPAGGRSSLSAPWLCLQGRPAPHLCLACWLFWNFQTNPLLCSLILQRVFFVPSFLVTLLILNLGRQSEVA